MCSNKFAYRNSQVIKPQDEILLPDNTFLSAIFSNNDISNEFMDKLSIAKGRIAASSSSKIHFHPIVTQVTYVLSGSLEVIMKNKKDKVSYKAYLNPGESIITEPNTFFQLVNNTTTNCEVLYIVNPAFLFELNESLDEVVYNDAFIFEESWEELSSKNWMHDIVSNDTGYFEKLRKASKLRMSTK